MVSCRLRTKPTSSKLVLIVSYASQMFFVHFENVIAGTWSRQEECDHSGSTSTVIREHGEIQTRSWRPKDGSKDWSRE